MQDVFTIDDPDSVEHRWEVLRRKRDYKLQKSDRMMFWDSPLTEEQKQAWSDYRQALRDLPANTTDPTNVVWPPTPE